MTESDIRRAEVDEQPSVNSMVEAFLYLGDHFSLGVETVEAYVQISVWTFLSSNKNKRMQ